MKDINNFTHGRIFVPLVRFALPVLLALFLQTMYGAVDLLVVGQFGSAADVSAVSTGSQLMMAVTTVITGLAMGLTVFVGREIGAGHQQEAGQIIGSGIWLFGMLALVLTAALTVSASAGARIMQAPKEAFLFCFIGYFNGCGNTVFVMFQGIISAFGIRIPVSWIMSRQVPVSLFHIGLATPVSTIVQILMCGFFFVIALRRRGQKGSERTCC